MSDYTGNYGSSSKKDSIFNGYKMALYAYWTNRPITSIEHLSKIISENTDEDISCLYRLWIEVLSDQKDIMALTCLNRHLLYRLSSDSDSSSKYQIEHSLTALRGLIHCELDELEAAKLIYSSVERDKKNQYVQELGFVISNRTNLQPNTSSLWEIKDKINDYFVLTSLVKGLIINNQTSKLNTILNRIDSIFESSPIHRQYQLHNYFDYADYTAMYRTAFDLLEIYPTNQEYKIFAAYASIKLGNYYEANKILKHSYFITQEEDLDLLYLLLISEVEILKQEYSEGNLEYVNQMLNTEMDYNILALISKVESLLENNGFFVQDLDSLKNEINDIYCKLNLKDDEESVEDHTDQQEVPTCWITVVGSREYHSIRNSKLSTISTIQKQLQEKTKSSDICFVVYQDYRNLDSSHSKSCYLRIGAVYQVESKTGINDSDCKLTLLARPKTSIPINHEFKDTLREGDCFELDLSALDVLTSSIKEYNEDRTFATSMDDMFDSMLVKKIS